MKSETRIIPLRELSSAYDNKELVVNPEYQRGARWTPAQKRGLVDSILRGYTIPLFYIHIKETFSTLSGSRVEQGYLVDGQQRLDAINDYLKNGFSLESAEKTSTRSVSVHSSHPTRWSGKRYSELEETDQKAILAYNLGVVIMREEMPNEVRDLFIRLQSGTPLTPQEKRDAWPGSFSQFVIKWAGKDGHPVSKPHPFFQCVKHTGKRRIPGDDQDHYIDGFANTRKFFAGLAMTLSLREEKDWDFVDLRGTFIDNFYLAKADFDEDSPSAKRVLSTLDRAVGLRGFSQFRSGAKLTYQNAFHFLILLDDYIRLEHMMKDWESRLIPAFNSFLEEVAKARKEYTENGRETESYSQYVRLLSGSGSDSAKVIRDRHTYLSERVHALIHAIPVPPPPPPAKKENITVTVHWKELGIDQEVEIIHEKNDVETVILFCERLIEQFGDEMLDFMSSHRVIRYPISKKPEVDFVNGSTGQVYSHAAIGTTGYFICLHSSRDDKIKRLREFAKSAFPQSEGAFEIG